MFIDTTLRQRFDHNTRREFVLLDRYSSSIKKAPSPRPRGDAHQNANRPIENVAPVLQPIYYGTSTSSDKGCDRESS
jgi:hypothetical protein